MKMSKRIIALFILLIVLCTILTACSSSSSYDLHNKDGSLNMQYVQDMNDYFKKHPEKLP